MKLLSVSLARSIWLGPVSDFNPRGTSLYSILFPLLAGAYSFRKYPPASAISDLSKGVEFGGGEFSVDGDHPIQVGVTFYNDGIVADTISSTENSDLFLIDIFNRLSEVFKMPPYESVIRKKVYLSQVFVTTDRELESIVNPKIKQVLQFLASNVEEGTDIFSLGGLMFIPNQTSKSPPAPFRFERALGVPFSEKRYFSAAPLTTNRHLELLDKLEEILS